MQVLSVASRVTMGYNSSTNTSTGWVASPVAAGSVVNVVVEAVNPEVSSGWWNIPIFQGVATQSVNPGSPNGALTFTSNPGAHLSGAFGIVVWYAE